jgi:hypothetical protein
MWVEDLLLLQYNVNKLGQQALDLLPFKRLHRVVAVLVVAKVLHIIYKKSIILILQWDKNKIVAIKRNKL